MYSDGFSSLPTAHKAEFHPTDGIAIIYTVAKETIVNFSDSGILRE
jgi:hypothetical protein